MKKILIRIISGFILNKNHRRNFRNAMTVGFGVTQNRGKNNRIVHIDNNGRRHNVRRLPGCKISFRGNDNYIEVWGDLNQMRMDVKMQNNSKIIIKPSSYEHRNFKIRGMQNCTLLVGKNFFMDGVCEMIFADNTNITIGDDTMIATGSYIRTGDGHQILSDGVVINKNADVYIGNRVWVGYHVTILKGTYIMDDCVVGARSLVNRKFDETGVIIAGVPAKIIKHNITWNRQKVD